ncbi:ATP-binding protein [Streptomyces mirabilis]|uniref:ATP-binding protein n=1 Tax=Streptomyces mirabilis TaxID=68239 RepID=UPI003800A90B
MSRPLEESPYAFTVLPLVEEVSAARDRVADRARRLGLDLGEELTHDLKLLTGELVANSVTHTKAACVVCVRWTGERLRVEVTDVDPALVAPSEALSTDEHGRGLFLVAALATEWGSHPCTAGKTTWFELAIPTSVKRASTVMSSQDDVPAEKAIVTCAGVAHPAVAEPVSIAAAHLRIEHQAA